MNYLVCPKCKEMNNGSLMFCSNCGESLRGAEVIEPSNEAPIVSSDNNRTETETPAGVYIALGVGIVATLIGALLGWVSLGQHNISKDLAGTLAALLICPLPLLLIGLMFVALGIIGIIHPEKMQSKPETGRTVGTEAILTQTKCSICNRTNADYLRDLKRKDPKVYIISSKFIGTCPVCKKAYCVEHAAYDGEIDHEVCPIHTVKLIVQ